MVLPPTPHPPPPTHPTCPFPSWPAALLDRDAAAMGFALVKTCGSVGSFLGPLLIGWLADLMHGYSGAVVMLAGVSAAAAALVCGGLCFWQGRVRGWVLWTDGRPQALQDRWAARERG